MVKAVRALYRGRVLRILTDLRDDEEVKVVIVRGSEGLREAIGRIPKDYTDVDEGPLEILLESRR
jgi:predicted DNA-binding antitoxin AbrB/MazE fold protein